MNRAVVVLVTSALCAASCSVGAPPKHSPPASPFPPRPTTSDIQTVDPCAALSGAQLSSLDIREQERQDLSPDVPACRFAAPAMTSYTVQLLRFTGARAVLPGYPAQQATDIFTNQVQTEVDGFGAVQAQLRRGTPASCALTIDTGDNSSIQFYYSTLDVNATSLAELKAGCDKARHFASLGLRTLSGQ